MQDSLTLQWVIPAISLGYTVGPDINGKLRFRMAHVTIIYRHSLWIASDGIDPDRRYTNLKDALTEEI